jgi:hypothetical protein
LAHRNIGVAPFGFDWRGLAIIKTTDFRGIESSRAALREKHAAWAKR